jgi:hypothetical protein
MLYLGRLYFDGSAAIFCNGNIIAISSQFSLLDVEVIVGVLDLEDVRSFRTSASRSSQGSQEPAYQRIEVPMSLSRKGDNANPLLKPSPPIEVEYHSPQEEIAYAPAACEGYEKLILTKILILDRALGLPPKKFHERRLPPSERWPGLCKFGNNNFQHVSSRSCGHQSWQSTSN